MGAFQRDEQRFVCKGLNLNAPLDAMPDGKYPIVQNVRTYQQGIMTARPGLTTLVAIGAGQPIHSLSRLNDPTAFAASPFWRVAANGVVLRAGNATFPQIDTGYSGNPLTFVVAEPFASPGPWMYVGDSVRQRKFDVNSHLFPLGIAPPATEPGVTLGPLFTDFLQDFGAGTIWVAAGTVAGATSRVFRINTTINQILYDSGSTGNCSVVPTSMAGIAGDAVVNFNGAETVPIQSVCVAVASTTIASIIYDSGTTGLCTIQPAASLGTGQLEAPDPNTYRAFQGEYAVPRGTAGTPPVPDTTGLASTRIRQIDFPVNCIVVLGSTEVVRILSVAVGPDGVQSFRCSTTSTHTAGQTIAGLSSFRASTAATYTNGQTLQASAVENVLTPPAGPTTPTQTVGGIQNNPGWTIVNNWSQINGRATLPDDDVHLSIRFSDCTVVSAVRIYLDIDSSTNDFTRNYFFFEWRANDIIDAIQNSNADQAIQTLQTTRQTTVQNAQLNTAVQATPKNRSAIGLPIATNATSAALGLGNNQWLELRCKVRDLIQVGTDTSRTLGNILAAEVLVAFTGSAPLTVDYASCVLTGGFGPDVGRTGLPISYAYRYRSSITGARSNPSPASRVHVMPRRQSVVVTGVQSPDTQVDLIDWFRMGGALDKMTYVGTTSNTISPSFTDNLTDSAISGGEVLTYDYFAPWATTDKFRTGTANVSGTALSRVSGDNFNAAWAPGTPIIVNGQTCTLKAQPPSTGFLEVNENVGSATAVTWTVPVPTLLGQPMYGLFGPVNGALFGCGDPNNPGALYWTFPDDPDRTSDANVVVVTSGSERLQNGFLYDDRPYVFSTDQLYAVVADGNGNWKTDITPCGKGSWTPWSYCLAPEGVYFLYKDGIYLSTGGAAAVSITDADLYPLFPHDGAATGTTVFGVLPPDMTQTTKLRLSYVGGWVYFDYQDTGANLRTLAFRTSDASWWLDIYTPGVSSRLNQPGPQVLQEMIGGSDGNVYTPGGITDNGTAYTSQVQMVLNEGDPRKYKLYRDTALDADLGGGQVTVGLTATNGAVNLGSTVLSGTSPRASYPIGIVPALGAYGTNLAITCTWSPQTTAAPALYLIDTAYQNEVEQTTSWLSGPTTHGFKGYQQVAGFLAAYLSTQALTLTLIIDGVQYSYSLPSSGGIYAKNFVWLSAVKGLTFQYGFQSSAAFLLFDKDCEAWVQPWGQDGGYQKISPF